MRLVLENPPFFTPWSGKDSEDGSEEAVKAEFAKGLSGRWGAGLPSGGDGQLLFLQSAETNLILTVDVQLLLKMVVLCLQEELLQVKAKLDVGF